jgi:thioesterase DpgC
MTATGVVAGVDRWAAATPALTGDYRRDLTALRTYTGAGEEILAALPGRPERDRPGQHTAELVFEASRALRDRFVNAYAGRLYDDLTDHRTRRPRLPELVLAAADRCPGLVPDRQAMAAEHQRVQRHKEGREIDQGLFIRGLLRDPSVGRHLMDTMRMPVDRSRELLDGFRRDGRVDLDTVLVERRDGTARVTVHNEHCLNAEDHALIRDMETAVDLVLLDDSVRVGVLRGGVMTHPRYRGRRVFSAGINLADLRDGRISLVDFLLGRELGYLSKLLHGVLPPVAGYREPSIQKPWLAAVDSFAIGGGMQLLLTVDWVVAADDAYFSLPAAKEGIVPGVANFRLSRFTGSRLARQVILGGRRIYATDPEARLVCDAVVPAAEVDAAVEAGVRALDSPAVAANRRMLGLAEESPERLREYLAEFAFVQACRLYGRDVLDKVDRDWSAPGART